jgi:hypothetical protein
MGELFQISIKELISCISCISSIRFTNISEAYELVSGGDNSKLSALIEKVRLTSRQVRIEIHSELKVNDTLYRLYKSIDDMNEDLSSLNSELYSILLNPEHYITIGTFLMWPPMDRCMDKKLNKLNARLCKSYKLIDNLHTLLLYQLN